MTVQSLGRAPLVIASNGSSELATRYFAVRRWTEQICEPLCIEDYVIQSTPDASPVKWHLAHTSWFFETFILVPHSAHYRPFDQTFQYIFNSYYKQLGGH